MYIIGYSVRARKLGGCIINIIIIIATIATSSLYFFSRAYLAMLRSMISPRGPKIL